MENMVLILTAATSEVFHSNTAISTRGLERHCVLRWMQLAGMVLLSSVGAHGAAGANLIETKSSVGCRRCLLGAN